MILKDDSPLGILTRPPSSPPPLSSPLSLPPSTTLSEPIPSYQPPLFPATAHLATADPAPWSRFPPPRYKFRKRPARFIPVVLIVTMSAVVLGACINFTVESVIRIATTR